MQQLLLAMLCMAIDDDDEDEPPRGARTLPPSRAMWVHI